MKVILLSFICICLVEFALRLHSSPFDPATSAEAHSMCLRRVYLPMTVARARCHQPLRRGRGGSVAAGGDSGVASAATISAGAGAEGSTVGPALAALGGRSSASASGAAATGAGSAIDSS
jgi:hypothetical protein